LLGQGHEVRDNLSQVVGPSKAAFTEAQAQSAVALLEEIAAAGGNRLPVQSELIDQVRAELLPPASDATGWK
jgi:hypothetical protein